MLFRMLSLIINHFIQYVRYWKMSLLVHPDKCSHPQAQQAFVKLNKAFKELQDPDKVSSLCVNIMDEGYIYVFCMITVTFVSLV